MCYENNENWPKNYNYFKELPFPITNFVRSASRTHPKCSQNRKKRGKFKFPQSPWILGYTPSASIHELQTNSKVKFQTVLILNGLRCYFAIIQLISNSPMILGQNVFLVHQKIQLLQQSSPFPHQILASKLRELNSRPPFSKARDLTRALLCSISTLNCKCVSH